MEENVGLIVYNGAMVDVGSLLQKLEKSEKVRAEVEQKLQLLEEKTGKEQQDMLVLLMFFRHVYVYRHLFIPIYLVF